jgi:hypothetical protein
MLRVSWKMSLIAAQTRRCDAHIVVHQLAGQAEGLLAHQLDGGAVGEQAHVASVTRRPASTERAMASESTVCTPMTLISGRTALM